MKEQKGALVRQLYMPAILCTALWGSAAPCIKKGYELFEIAADASFSQLLFAGWRFALAGVLVLIVAKLKGHRIIPVRSEWKPILWISLFQSMIQYICYYIGLSATTGTKGAVLSGTQTFFALIFAHLFLKNDKLNRQKALGCVCGFAGVLVLGMGGLNGFNLLGDGLVLLSAVSAGAGALVSRIFTPGRDPMLLTGWQLLLGGLLLGGIGVAGGGHLGAVTLTGVLLLGYMIVLSAAAFTIWTALLGKYPVGRVSLFCFLIPVFGAIFSALVLGENIFTLRNLAALALVSGGIAIANYVRGSKTGEKQA
ncbi:MAG TPA: DMT family transporter [Candidatus Agathobaculum stercoravium]|nr:DMT family transporter [Candidatus Agathobaculum stercoravium]